MRNPRDPRHSTISESRRIFRRGAIGASSADHAVAAFARSDTWHSNSGALRPRLSNPVQVYRCASVAQRLHDIPDLTATSRRSAPSCGTSGHYRKRQRRLEGPRARCVPRAAPHEGREAEATRRRPAVSSETTNRSRRMSRHRAAVTPPCIDARRTGAIPSSFSTPRSIESLPSHPASRPGARLPPASRPRNQRPARSRR